MNFFLRLAFATTALLTASAVHGAEPEYAWPDGSPEQIKEDVFGVRFRQTREIDGLQAGLNFLKKEYQRSPRPYVKAYYAWICLFAEGWDYPGMKDEALGLRLAEEAAREGSVVARDVLARAKGKGLGAPADPAEAVRLLTEASTLGSTNSLARLGYYYSVGYGVAPDLPKADRLARRAAEKGQPFGLMEIGQAYEAGGGAPNLDRALQYYNEASFHADPEAWKKLRKLEQQGVPQAKLYLAIGYVREANRSAWIAPTRVREHVATLTALAGDNPEALLELGRAHLDGEYAKRDYALARDYITRSAGKGDIDAMFLLAKMKLRGWGEKAAPAEGLTEIKELARQGSVEAASYLGYVYYWAPSEAPGVEKNAETAFDYIRKAAALGHPLALLNLAMCYENGIGTPVNYPLAAKIYWQAYTRGYLEGREKVRRLMPFIKDV